MAVALSMADDEERQERCAQSRMAVSAKLQQLGLRRIDTCADGNCQFIALCYSGGMPVSHEQLRSQICDYLVVMERTFSAHFDTRWNTYAAYVENMRRDGSWGDDLTLQCASHLCLRPIRIVTDDASQLLEDDGYQFHPPSSISSECWGPVITLACLQFSHYEATEPIVSRETSVGVKSETN